MIHDCPHNSLPQPSREPRDYTQLSGIGVDFAATQRSRGGGGGRDAPSGSRTLPLNAPCNPAAESDHWVGLKNGMREVSTTGISRHTDTHAQIHSWDMKDKLGRDKEAV